MGTPTLPDESHPVWELDSSCL